MSFDWELGCRLVNALYVERDEAGRGGASVATALMAIADGLNAVAEAIDRHGAPRADAVGESTNDDD